MKTLVIGASGCLGGILREEFRPLGPVVGTYCTHPQADLIHLDVTNAEEVRRLFLAHRPDVVLHCGAFTHVDGCEENPELSRRINVEGTRCVFDLACSFGARYVFFSSDYVFDGRDGPYREEDPPHPIQVYGRHKWEAEQFILARPAHALVVRVHGVFGWEPQGKNFVLRLITSLRQGRPVTVPDDQVGSPTYAPNLAAALRELVQKDARGLYHLSGTSVLDRASFARLIAREFALPESLILAKPTRELNQRAPRPLRSGLLVDKARAELRTPLWSAEQALRHMRATEPPR